MNVEITYLPEDPSHDLNIEAINEEAFGPGRYARAAYKIREGGPHDPALSFVVLADGEIVGSVRQTWISAGTGAAVLLGPLAVRPAWKNRGYGKRLVVIATEAARDAGAPMVLLVGDPPYYRPLGFEPFPKGKIRMPRPVDPDRLLFALFDEKSLEDFSGDVVHAALAPRAAMVSDLRDATSRQDQTIISQDRQIRQKAGRG